MLRVYTPRLDRASDAQACGLSCSPLLHTCAQVGLTTPGTAYHQLLPDPLGPFLLVAFIDLASPLPFLPQAQSGCRLLAHGTKCGTKKPSASTTSYFPSTFFSNTATATVTCIGHHSLGLTRSQAPDLSLSRGEWGPGGQEQPFFCESLGAHFAPHSSTPTISWSHHSDMPSSPSLRPFALALPSIWNTLPPDLTGPAPSHHLYARSRDTSWYVSQVHVTVPGT